MNSYTGTTGVRVTPRPHGSGAANWNSLVRFLPANSVAPGHVSRGLFGLAAPVGVNVIFTAENGPFARR